MCARMIIVIATFLFSSGPLDAATYSIVHPQFSSFVDPENYTVINPAQDGTIARSSLGSGLLYFSTAIVGDTRTFEHLEEHRHLELAASIWCDGERRDTIHIGMSTRNWERDREALRIELEQRGTFTWRTYMNTRKIHCDQIEIVLKDGSGRFVSPLGHRGTYTATVRVVH